MSEASQVYGRIISYSSQDHERNLKVLSKLPKEKKEAALFHREMFNKPTTHAKGEYVLAFSRSYKNIEHRWDEWIAAFEKLLKKMKWASVRVHLETGMFGVHQYHWLSKDHASSDYLKTNYGKLVEKKKWFFGEGFSNFWGVEAKHGWDDRVTELRALKVIQQSLDMTIDTDKSFLQMVWAKSQEQDLEVRANSDGLKNMINHLIKMYINHSEAKLSSDLTRSGYKMGNVFDDDSLFRIKDLKLTLDPSTTDWVAHFVEHMEDEQN